ncbi:MAG: ABC transporter permease [Deltaproteobacteria bacterium]|nr:ABC transporter permease [Deltaproteobacteria bacterium]
MPVSTAPLQMPRMPRKLALRWFELLMAGRLLRSRRSAQLSLVTTLSIAGIALGVAALIVVLAVNTGFQTAFRDRILASYPHIVVMQRGVDLRDWRTVAARLRNAPGVRHAGPATYDDMMLSAAQGRAGAIVRGVQPDILADLPPGALIAGKLDTRGERPQWFLTGDQLQLKPGIAGARHLLVLGAGDAVRPVPLLPVPGALGSLAIIDAETCSKGAKVQGSIYLRQGEGIEPMRAIERGGCGELATWEALAGDYLLTWQSGGVQLQQKVTLGAGKADAVVIWGDHASVAPTMRDDLAPTAAAVAVVGPAERHLTILDPQGRPVATPGEWLALPSELPAAALGEGLAKRLAVKVGDEVRAVSPLRGLDRVGEGSEGSASGRFRVTAILRTGFHDHDQRLALVDFAVAQRFLGRGDIARWVEARVDDPILATRELDRFKAAVEPADLGDLLGDARELDRRLGELAKGGPGSLDVREPTDSLAVIDNWGSGLRAMRQTRPRVQGLYRVIDWEEMNRNIFDAARMQKVAMSLFPFIIVLVAALNVVGTQAVIVHERARDIAILRAMGSTRRSVASVFFVQGLVVGLAGTLIGLAVGGLACWLLDVVGYPLDPSVYLISRLPVQAEPQAFALAGGAAVVLALAAEWLAAQRASVRSPVEALRRLDG